MPVTAVIEFTFSPIAQIGPWSVRLETIALAVTVFVALLVAAGIARGTAVDLRRPPDAALPDDDGPNHLRADDLLFIAVAAIPGAVAGGRLGYWLLHLDYYTAHQGAIFDIGQGGFELSLAVVGGTLTGAFVAALLGAPVGRWLHAAIVPLLLALAAGKAAMVLGGDGQGVPWDGNVATAYLGPGPWGSLAPMVPSHAAQAYEAFAAVIVLLLMLVLLTLGRFGRRAGGAFLAGVALWAVGRAIVASTWRDPAVVGRLNMGQVLAIGVAAGMLVLLLVHVLVLRRRPEPTAESVAASETEADPAGQWPDPESRPRF
ncbi:MAG TPA: prolipoprotein diacylglyceryl transferase family protein [Candidatus Limnocylindrales bacterium]|jgi:prolipoprotein diacylglyceryltransferase